MKGNHSGQSRQDGETDGGEPIKLIHVRPVLNEITLLLKGRFTVRGGGSSRLWKLHASCDGQ